MDVKLTLKLNGDIIENAKAYAKWKNTSLSKLIESYLGFLISQKHGENEGITPLVKSLSGVVKLDKNFNHKEAYRKHLVKKYK